MSQGLAAVQARVAQLQALVAPAATPPSGGAAFARVLAGQTGVGSAGSVGVGAAAGEQVIDIATKYLGIDYRWGGTDPETGLDCSGLTQLVYRQVGVDLPRVSRDQARAGTAVASVADAEPGDLVFFGSPVHHVGIYLGDGKMLNSPRTGAQVRVEKLWDDVTHIRRVLPDSVGAGSGSGGLSSVGTGSAVPGPYASLFASAGARHGLDPALLSAIAKAESSYNPAAISPAGARGLMQLMPGTARDLGVNPDDPTQAVAGAARLMADHLRSFGRVDLALAAYNAGPGAVRKHGGIPPYEETRNYVQRVQSFWKELR